MNERIVCRGGSGSVKFFAWTASVVLHLMVLTAFAVFKFSQCEARGRERGSPMGSVSRVRKPARAAPVIPKPKVKNSAGEQSIKDADRLLNSNQVLFAARPASQDLVDLVKAAHSQSISSLSSGAGWRQGIEFFGSVAEQRKVCYVVDCSGSMKGVFGRVREELKESIVKLQADQYFYIIFFGGDKLYECGDGRLLRATGQAKSAACDFVDSVRPAGRTNAVAGLERAVQIRDAGGVGPSVVYFLTDGFELADENAQSFSRIIANLRKRFAPESRINTIGFWPQSSDREMLEAIARQSGGEFTFVAGRRD